MGVVTSLVLVFIVLYGLHYLVKVVKMRGALKDIPSPPSLAVIGHVSYFTNPVDILDNLVSIVRDYGGYVKMHLFGMYSILVADPEKAEAMLSSTKLLTKSDEYRFLDRWLGAGLLTSKPEKWRRHRKIITPTFHFQILEQFITVFNTASDIFVRKLQRHAGKSNFDVYPFVTLCTLDVICETAMGIQVNAQKDSDSEYVRCVQKMSRIIRRRLFSLVKMVDVLYYFTKDYQHEMETLKILHGYTNAVIEKRKKELENNNFNLVESEHGGKPKMAFLDLLLCATLDGRPLTNLEIREEVDTFMFEGHDTTASAVAYALYCLSQHQDIQEQAVEELRTIFGNDKTRHATYSELQSMKYLEMVIKEVMRLYPSVPYFGRIFTEDVEVGGQLFPKGTSVVIFAYGLHRNPKVYVDPDKFDPSRFLPDNQSKRSPYSFLPFSAGPRNCIGQKFAMLEMKAILCSALRNYVLLPVENFKPQIVPDLIIKSTNGVEICLANRDF